MAGREGMVGWSALLTSVPVAMHRPVVLLPGEALAVRTRDFRVMIDRIPALRTACLRYVDVVMAQISQTAACNGRHQMRERIARWLLMCVDRIDGDEISITQEFMSSVFGVRRPTISDNVASLPLAGLIQQSRGKLTVLNRTGLEAEACSCYRIIRSAEARF
jgi:CRP-like cAMP-binding protein